MLNLDTLSPCRLSTLLASLRAIAPLLDALSDVVFFIKDTQARYVLVNQTLARRCGVASPQALLGLTAEQVFPARLGASYTAQDKAILDGGGRLADQLELHLHRLNQPVWCVTHKLALRDEHGTLVGLAGISKDLPGPQAQHPAYQRLAVVDAHIRTHFARAISLSELTALADVSVAQLERQCKRVFQLTPRQMIHKARLEHASHLLRDTHLLITEVALRCGYSDHSAFSRQFRALTGVAPREYREVYTLTISHKPQ